MNCAGFPADLVICLWESLGRKKEERERGLHRHGRALPQCRMFPSRISGCMGEISQAGRPKWLLLEETCGFLGGLFRFETRPSAAAKKCCPKAEQQHLDQVSEPSSCLLRLKK